MKSDVYRLTDQLEEAVLEAMATRLEVRAQHPLFMRMMEDYLTAMRIDRAGAVLDLGCGTGVAARVIARRPDFEGRVVAIDRSAYFVRIGKRLAGQEGIGTRVDFRIGDIHSLRLDAGEFDAVVAHTLISHVDDPQAALKEMKRVTKPDGLITVFDADYASLTFAQRDPAKGRRDDDAIIAATVTNPRIMRHLPILIRAAGMEIVKHFGYVLSEAGKADFWRSGIESFRKLLPTAGAMSASEASAWANGVIELSERGEFFAACNYYAYVMRPERT